MGDQLRPTRERLQYIRELVAIPEVYPTAVGEAYCLVIGETLAEVDGLNAEIELWKTRFYASQDTLKRELNSRNAAIAEIKDAIGESIRELEQERDGMMSRLEERDQTIRDLEGDLLPPIVKR